MKSGIYKIVNTVTSKVYVGSASNLDVRNKDHFKKLARGIHRNGRLQNSYNEHGSWSFCFIVIEYCNIEVLTEREQFWIDKYKSYNDILGYNISPTAGNSFGVKRSDNYKKRASERQKGIPKPYMSELMLGRKLSEATKKKMSESGKGRIVTQDTRDKIGAKNQLNGYLRPYLKEFENAVLAQIRHYRSGSFELCNGVVRDCIETGFEAA